MKRLYIIVEGQTEQEFVNQLLAPYLQQHGIYDVRPILIRTSKTGRGGFINYQHLRNDAMRLLKSTKNDFAVSMFVDFFRIPEVPDKPSWNALPTHKQQVEQMERCIAADINDRRFIPYIQLHEFEALLFASNVGFEALFTETESTETQRIVDAFDNPEDINSHPDTAPSKRIIAIKNNYDKVLEGNLIAAEIGLKTMLDKCPRFNEWIETLIAVCRE